MNEKKAGLLDASLVRFLLVGVGNTLLSAGIMVWLEDWGYWPSTAVAYLAGAVLSFFLNRSFTFHSEEALLPSAGKFAVNVAVCYVLAYALAQPLGRALLGNLGLTGLWLDRLTKLGGMGLYTLLNYFGQRFFAFRKA